MESDILREYLYAIPGLLPIGNKKKRCRERDEKDYDKDFTVKSNTFFPKIGNSEKDLLNNTLFTNHLMNNFAYFVVNVKAFSLCFNLLQENIFHNTQFEEVFDQHERNRQEANRFLFAVLIGNEYTQEQLQIV